MKRHNDRIGSEDLARGRADAARSGLARQSRAAVLLAAGCTISLGAAQADVLLSQGGTYTFDASSNTVTTSIQSGTTLPAGLITGSSTAIDATISGVLTLSGLPTGATAQFDAVVNEIATGECALSVSCNSVQETLVNAGDVAVTLGSSGGTAGTDAIILDSVAGGANGPAALIASSFGDDGLGGAGGVTELSSPDGFPIEATYGTMSGSVAIDLESSAAVTVTGTATGSGSGSGTDLLTPTLVGVKARSDGGGGSAVYWVTGGVEKQESAYVGRGGASGGASVTTKAGSTITLAQTGAGANAVGIDARAVGGTTGSFFNTVDGAFYFASNGGAAGPVTVTHGGGVTVSVPQGLGISAVSIGGDGADTDVFPPNTGGPPNGPPGNGGTVDVTVTGSVDMTGGGAGVFASSQAGAWTPGNQTYLAQGGAVTVAIASGATISTGSTAASAAPLAFGVMGLSAGTRLDSSLTADPNYQGTGAAGTVEVTNAGMVTTNGPTAIGVAALGIGGNLTVATYQGGANILGNTATVTPGGGCATLSGGCADVTLTNTGTVSTQGTGAAGLVAIASAGGGIVHNDAAASVGSDGEWAAGTSVGSNPTYSTSATGGGGVTINHSGSVITGNGPGGGIGAIGIVAQSIGGSGGLVGGSQAAQRLGDSSGGGGDGATVTVNLDDGALVETRGKSAIGVLLQSIGGGGGSGTNATGSFVAVGGTGGDGGDGGTVTLNTTGTTSITTLANGAHGAVVQSIGGGGGNGGYADNAGVFIDIAIGGTGGAGGTGGVAAGYNNGGSAISTIGNRSTGMLVQSIGGGGGTGGGAMSSTEGATFSVSIAAGGDGGVAGAGGFATGINHGTITTGLSPAQQQNIDFMGDAGFFYATLSDGTTLGSTITSGSLDDGEITATLSDATMSDGTVLNDVSVAGLTITGTIAATGETFTGTIDAGGIDRAVGTDTTSAIVTGLFVNGKFTADIGGPNINGADSDGLVVQSIGGGGGLGGTASAKSTVLPMPFSKAAGVPSPSIDFAMATGGTGGSGGDGGGVTAGNYASIVTYGDFSRGILAQSIGGGGGNGGDGTAGATTIQSSSFDLSASVGGGGSGGSSGNGAIVTAFNGASNGSSVGTIVTSGQFSPGIVAQSIGAGGGTGGAGSAAERRAGNLRRPGPGDYHRRLRRRGWRKQRQRRRGDRLQLRRQQRDHDRVDVLRPLRAVHRRWRR